MAAELNSPSPFQPQSFKARDHFPGTRMFSCIFVSCDV